MWSSLPVLLLWMIKDKLDIFDNWRLAAVCRYWRSASASYPKALRTVGDGVPWIWHRNDDFAPSSREIISFARKCILVIDRPEFVDTSMIFSKQGWALLQKREETSTSMFLHLFLMNILTGDKIELPGPLGANIFDDRHISFTTSGGLPQRVFIVTRGSSTTVIVTTACPGDETWTSQTYSGLERTSSSLTLLTSIGHNIYFMGCFPGITVFNLADRSCKELQPLPGGSFYTEHGGELICVELKSSGLFYSIATEEGDEDDYVGFIGTVYRHDSGAPTSWEKLDNDAVMGTSWFSCDYHSRISAKGDGLKLYRLNDEGNLEKGIVVCYDLLTGTLELLPTPFEVNLRSKWLDIG